MPDVLEIAESFLREEVAPFANEIDHGVEALSTALKGLCDRNLMALRRPTAFGGPQLAETDFRRFQETVARYSGALAFLQTQHQSAGSMIAKSENEALKTEYLPKMANGERLVGIGFSQLRRSGPPIMRAEPATGGYRLSGHVPWITGFGLFPEFLLGATLPDGQALFVLLPFTSEPGLAFSEPMRLAAMESAQTVTAEISDFFVSEEMVVYIKPANWIQNNDMINVTLQGHFAVGCAQGGLDVVQKAAQKRGATFIAEAHLALQTELDDCRRAMAEAPASEETTEERLRVRAWAIDLAGRCAHAAVAASSGAANSVLHPAQRVYREALVFTVSAQTEAIMEATLGRLAARR